MNGLTWSLPALLVFGCAPIVEQALPEGLIVEPGEYSSPSGEWNLIITKDDKNLIQYRILEVNGPRSYRPEYDFTDGHRWAFFWESDERLWVHSSDIGPSVWTFDASLQWTQHWLQPGDSFVAEMPKPVWDFLPRSIRELERRKRETKNSSNKAIEGTAK